jgi:hypothetical protein
MFSYMNINKSLFLLRQVENLREGKGFRAPEGRGEDTDLQKEELLRGLWDHKWVTQF